MEKKESNNIKGDLVSKNISDATLSKPKKFFFRIIMIALPFIFLLLIEIGLRIFNYGGNLDLFVLQKDGVIHKYALNKDFTKRYFFQKGIETPIPLSQTFDADKSNSTYRIFCLGESSVQGFPYQANAAFPAMLKHLLASLHPQKNIEVVNCGVTAISSYSITDMAEEILEKYKPDLIILYAGHNEFYGVFGSASRLSFFDNWTLTHTLLKLQKSKLFLLTRDAVNFLFGKDISKDPTLKRGTMMGIVAKDIGIKLSDEIVSRTEISFRKNIEVIIEASKKHKTDIIICNLVSNKKGFSPFASQHSDYYDKKDTTLWKELSTKANLLRNEKRYKEASIAYSAALEIDSMYAETHYDLARCYYEMQMFDKAKSHYERAVDLDVIRFRAPSSFNKIIESVCRNNQVPFVDINNDFEQISENSIIGNEMLFEHVHPNQQGYFQIAKSIAKVMSEYSMIDKNWDWNKRLSDSAYYAMSNLTLLDKEIINYMLYQLTSHWPFTDRHKRTFIRLGDERTEQLAISFAKEDKNIVKLHIDYGLMLQEENKLDEALAEYKAALAIQPIKEIYNRIGQVYLIKTEKSYRDNKDFDAALINYEKGVATYNNALRQWPDDIELNHNLGILHFMRKDKWKEAEARFNKVLELNPSHKNSLAFLSQICLYFRRTDEAKKLITKGIELYPQQAEFYTDLGIILLQEKMNVGAKENFEKAVSINNDPRAKHFLKVLNNLKTN